MVWYGMVWYVSFMHIDCVLEYNTTLDQQPRICTVPVPVSTVHQNLTTVNYSKPAQPNKANKIARKKEKMLATSFKDKNQTYQNHFTSLISPSGIRTTFRVPLFFGFLLFGLHNNLSGYFQARFWFFLSCITTRHTTPPTPLDALWYDTEATFHHMRYPKRYKHRQLHYLNSTAALHPCPQVS